ncbi:hypothetical protein [Cupriavidus necator]|uniref:hypothetical protein n=1 Tax=Cupriavidus necator TaxID=106590 RepID=UPI0030F42E08
MRNDHACAVCGAVCGAVRMGLKLPAAAVVILSRGMEKRRVSVALRAFPQRHPAQPGRDPQK